MPPKFIQISVSNETENFYAGVYALGEDGTVWGFTDASENDNRGWYKLEGLRKVEVVEQPVVVK